jgi:tetratricopeptide (TPR) repeat protein/tRNA A-37 threonylcarbamoyl transferase component Bud32
MDSLGLEGESIPARIGRFTVLERVGAGAMSIVFSAYDAVLDRKIAVKLVHRERNDDADERARIVREAQAMSRLSHPNVAHVYEVGEHEGRTFIAMEFVRGQTLRAWADASERSWREILSVYARAGRGLAAAHTAGLVHRHVGADNAMIDADGRVCVLDLGLARDDADARNDQHSFCAALSEALPRSGVPSWLRAAVARGLAEDGMQRHASMAALLVALAADPSRGRRRMLAAGGGVITLAAVLGGLAIDRERREQGCAHEAAAIATAWNDEARDRMRIAMLGTGASYAASSWATIEPRLDRYASEWSEVREHTCIAATVERTRSTELAERTTACLERRRLALLSFVEIASVDDPPLVGAVSAAATLPRLESCTNDAALMQAPTRPDDPAQREQIAALEAELTRNAALLATQRFTEGLPRARELADEAAALGWGLTHARALADLGAFATDVHDVTLAESSLQRAAEIALEHGADELAALAMGRLVTAIAFSRVKLERGLWWGWLASAVLDRQPEVDPVRRMDLAQRMGGLHQQRAAHREAKDAYAKAVALGEETFGPDHPLVVEAIDGVAFAQIELGEVDEAIASLQRGVASLEQSVGGEHPSVGDLLGTLAGAFAKRGDYTSQVAMLERAVAIEIATTGDDHPRIATRLTNLGQAYAHLDEHAKAEAAHARAIAILEAAHGSESARLSDAFFARGNYFAGRERCELALADFERARTLKAETGDPNHLHIGYLSINIAACRYQIGDAAGSERDYLRALEIVEPQRGEDDLITVMIRKDLALALFGNGKPAEALALASAMLDKCAQLECPPHKRSDMLMTIAKAKWALGQRSEGVAAMQEARREVERAEVKVNLPEIDAWLAAHTHE